MEFSSFLLREIQFSQGAKNFTNARDRKDIIATRAIASSLADCNKMQIKMRRCYAVIELGPGESGTSPMTPGDC